MAIRESNTRAVVITGASTGIGRATALHLARLGFRAYAGVRRTEDADSLRQEGAERLEPIMLDVTDPESVKAAARRVAEEVPEGLAGLVNNAGIVVPGPIELVPLDELRSQFEVNLIGAVAATQAFLPQLRKAKGRIVNIGSLNGFLSAPLNGPYSMSKFAMEAMSDALRMELKAWGIEVAILEPGSISTPIWSKSKARGKSLVEKIPPENAALYAPFIKGLEESADRFARMGIPPERVAEVVAHALTANRPRTRYRVGRDSQLLRLFVRWVPDRLRDRLILRAMGMSPNTRG